LIIEGKKGNFEKKKYNSNGKWSLGYLLEEEEKKNKNTSLLSIHPGHRKKDPLLIIILDENGLLVFFFCALAIFLSREIFNGLISLFSFCVPLIA